MGRSEEEIREHIKELVKEFYCVKFKPSDFSAGETVIRYAGRVFDEHELQALVDSSLDFWLTEGRYAEEFQSQLSLFFDLDYVVLTNSGSSANLLAFTALTSHLLGEHRLKPDDEIISVAAGFPTTVNPIIQNGMIPVFADIEMGTYNVNVKELEGAITEKTRAIFLAHTLGNPYNLDVIVDLVKKHDLWLIEDCCDALGSRFHNRLLGTFGHIATSSFYPAHHITTGEGGAVMTNDDRLARAIMSIRDWGRDCYCKGGENNTCGKRFSGRYGNLPYGYDHKYVYSHIGYNLKMTEMQAAIGVEQLKKLPFFIEKRKSNFQKWFNGLKKWESVFILPKTIEGADPAWFAFPITVRDNVDFSRTELTNFLSENRIETRNLFAGNLLRQPAYLNIRRRLASNLEVTDYVMANSFFLGTYPGLSDKMIDYTLLTINNFLANHCR